tara:strand:- start:6 stop:311 length:306 start_codon:yes stop_codon:yes gene_type:complete
MSKKLVNGVLVNMTADEISAKNAIETAWNDDALNRALSNLRSQRNKKLSDTDHHGLQDTATMSSEMTTYRQQLRDLPSNYTTSDSTTLSEDLSNLVWPTKP